VAGELAVDLDPFRDDSELRELLPLGGVTVAGAAGVCEHGPVRAATGITPDNRYAPSGHG
jgi:hypothetical protein